VTRRHLAVLSLLVLGAGPTPAAQHLPIKPYTTADGLAHNNVNRIVRDSRGFLWFCTADGLSRFDGYGFTNFGTAQGLPHANVTDLLETPRGDYWVATEGGLVRFDPKGRPDPRVLHENESTGRRAMFTVVLPDSPDTGDVRARAVTVLREGHDGSLWVGTNKGLYRLNRANGHESLRPVEIGLPHESPEQRTIADVLEDARGSLWIAAPSGLYRRWPDGSAARYTERDGLPGSDLHDVLEDHEGTLWAGTRLSGFFRFSADDSHRAPAVTLTFTYHPDDAAGLRTPWIFQLFEASDHRFWIATARGLAEFFPNGDDRGRHFHPYTERNGLTYFDITAVNEDLGGNLWMGTNTGGAMKLTLRGLSTYGDQDGVGSVNAIFEDRAGELCLRGHVLGDVRTSVFEGAKLDLLGGEPSTPHTRLGTFDGQRFDWFAPLAVDDLSWGWVSERVTLQARTGEWWVGTARGLSRYSSTDRFAQIRTARPLARYTTRDGLTDNQVFRLFEDSHGNVWVSTFNGLARWDPSSETLRDVTHSPGLPSFEDDRPRSFAEDASGTVWIGFNNGLARYAQGTFTSFAARDGLPPGEIMNIHVDRSERLWLASTQSGLVRVDQAGTDRPVFASYMIAQGLSSNNTAVITEDLQGHIYVGGGKGLDRLDPATGRVQHFTTADGVGSGSFLAAFRDRRGVLWFGMSSGLARLVPTPDRPATPPPTLITGVRVSGIPQPMSALGEQDVSLPDLGPDRNQLQIDFVGLGFRPGDVLSYQFRLQGADADWTPAAEQRVVTYASLSPGRYTFLVRAVNSDGVVSDRPASIAFTILRPFWLRWWFLLLSAVAVGSAGLALYRYRITRLLEMANMRTRIATDLHDDIGANLTRIALLTEVAKQTREGAAGSQADGPLASIARIARESVSSMSDIVWAIDPRRESLLDLTSRMRQHAEEVFTLRDVQLRFDAPTAADGSTLGVDIRRDLLLIFKEAVNNAARHSGCSRVEIDLHIAGSRLWLTVADNGEAGFDPSADQDGHGLRSMQRRAQRLKGTLAITSSHGAGTRITLNIPL
jgi:ligand-binding sensor domain-containing protein/signal transduction histidine kinase